jgi:2-methylisocitrate lyase-like PEP mutase family enzyme
MGGSGMAARNALPNTSIQTVKEVIDYETHVMSNTDLPIVADGRERRRQPDHHVSHRCTLERGGAAVIMLEDSTGPESEYGAARVWRGAEGCHGGPDQGGGRRPPGHEHVDHGAMRPAVEGLHEAETLDVLAALSDAGADAFFINGFTLDQQQRARRR